MGDATLRSWRRCRTPPLPYESAAARAGRSDSESTYRGLGSSGRSVLVARSPRATILRAAVRREQELTATPLLLATDAVWLPPVSVPPAPMTRLNKTLKPRFRPTHHPASHSGPSYTGKTCSACTGQQCKATMKTLTEQADRRNDRNHQSCAIFLRSAPRFCVRMQCGRFGEVVCRIVGTQTVDSPRKMAKIPLGLHFSRSLVASLCFDFEVFLRLSRTGDAPRHENRHAVPWNKAIGMSRRLCVTLSGEIPEALQCFAQVRDPVITPFLSTL